MAEGSSGSGNRTIRFSFQVDNQSLLQTKNAIKELTEEVKKLANELARAGQSMGAMGGKGGNPFFSGVTGKAGNVPGMPHIPPGGPSTQKVGIGTGIESMAQGLRDTATAGIGALKGMTGAVRDSVSGQVGEIERLRRSLQDLNEEFGKLSFADRNGPAGKHLRGQISARSAELSLEERITGENAKAEWEKAYYGPGGAGYVPPKTPLNWKGMAWGGLKGAMGVAGFLHATGKMYDAFAAPVRGDFSAQIDQALNSNSWRLARKAQFGQTFGGAALAGQQGDIAKSYFTYKAATDAGLVAAIKGGSELRKQAAQIQTDHFSDSSFSNLAEGGSYSGSLRKFARNASLSIAGMFKDQSDYETSEKIAFNKKMADAGANLAQQVAQNAAAMQAADPLFSARLNRTYGAAMGRAAMGRMGGYSGGERAVYTGAPAEQNNLIVRGISSLFNLPEGEEVVLADRMDELEGRLTEHGWDMGSYMASRRALGQTAGWGNRGKLGELALHMQAGGFQGVESMVNIGGQIGGGKGDEFVRNIIQKNIGARGLDPQAASEIFGLLGGRAMASGQFYGGADVSPAFQAMAAAMSTGGASSDMERSRGFQLGLGAFDKYISGRGIDPLQEALNVSAANTAMSGKSWEEKQAVMGMSPEARIAAIQGGKMNPVLQALGVSATDVKEYSAAQASTMFSRALESTFREGTDAAKALKGVREKGGDWRGWLEQQGDKDRAISGIAAVIHGGMGMSDMEAEYFIRAQLGENESKRLDAGGAWGAKIGLRDTASLKGQAGNLQAELMDVAKQLHELVTIFRASPELRKLHKGANAAGQAASDSDTGAGAAIGQYTRQLGEYTAQLKTIVANLHP